MREVHEDILLRVFVSETTKVKGKLLYEDIVLKARELGLAGATVLRGVLGYGADKRLHTDRVFALMENMPMVVEIVDSEEAIGRILPYLDETMQDGFVTLERVHVYQYRKNRC